MDDKIRSMILDREPDSDFRAYALSNGMIPMVQDGLAKAAAGITTIAEVFRVAISEEKESERH